MGQWPLKLENLHLYAVDPQNGQFNHSKPAIICVYLYILSLHIHTYILWGETRIPGDVWRLNFIDISRRETIVVPTCFYMVLGFCVRVALPLGEATSPKGEGWRGRFRLWLLHRMKAEDHNEVWVALKNRSWTSLNIITYHNIPLCPSRKYSVFSWEISFARLDHQRVYICLHHVCACFCLVLPILNDVKGSPSMAKMI